MQKLIVAIVCVLALTGCARKIFSEEERAKIHRDAEGLRNKVRPADLIEMKNYQDEGTHIVVFLRIEEPTALGDFRVVYQRVMDPYTSASGEDFRNRMVRVIPKDSPHYGTAARRFFENR